MAKVGRIIRSYAERKGEMGMKNKKILALAVSVAMMLQIFSPVYAEEVIVEQTETVQESDAPAEEPAPLQEDIEEPSQEDTVTVSDETEGISTPEAEPLESEGDLLLEEESESVSEDLKDMEGEGQFFEAQIDAEPESETESKAESDSSLTWDEEITLDLTDTTQIYTVSNNMTRAQEHTHQMSVECESGDADIVFEKPLTNIMDLAAGGNFYLTQDIRMISSRKVTIPAGVTVNLCLNGYSVTKSTWQTGYYIQIEEGAILNLCDCQGSGAIADGHGSSRGQGGAIYNRGTFHMYGGTITKNALSGKNHGIYSTGSLYMHGGAVTNITSTDAGAGIYVDGGRFEMTGGTISGNKLDRSASASIGGAGVGVKNADFVMTGGTIKGNTSDRTGGGVAVASDGDYQNGYKQSSFTISGGSVIEGNAAETGGAVYVGPAATMTMEGGTIRKNTGTEPDYGGGVIYIVGGSAGDRVGYSKLIINDGIIEENESDIGTIHMMGASSVYMYGGEIRNNTATSGGAIYAIRSHSEAPTEVLLAGGTIFGNKVTEYGGGLFLNGAATTISGTVITGNTAAYGGGVHVYSNDSLKVTGGSVTGNHAWIQGGGISYEYNIEEEDVNGSGEGVYDPILLSGTPVINGNTSGEQEKYENNLFLFSSHNVKIDGALTDGTAVGVTVQYPPEGEDMLLFSEKADADYSQYFMSDDPEYAVWNDEDNRLYLQRCAVYALTYKNIEEAGWQDGVSIPKEYKSGRGLSELPVPVREGYRFDGWYRSENMLPDEFVISISRKEAGDMTLWAKWTDIEDPSVTAVPADGIDAGKWQKEAAFILHFSDNKTQSPRVSVKVDEGAYQIVDGIKDAARWNVTQEGIHTYTFLVEDEAGNTAETSAVLIKLDKTAPIFDTVSFESKTNEDGSWNIGENTKNAVVTIIETQSGVDSVGYVMEPVEGEKRSGTAEVSDNRAYIRIPEDFVGVIRINCTDAVGNQAKELVLRAAEEQIETEMQTETKPEISKSEKEAAELSLRKTNTLTAGSKKLTVKWGKVKGADGYEIYAAICGKEMQLVKTVSADKERSVSIRKIGKKKIKKAGEYKVKVKAYRIADGEKLYLAEGLTLHAAGPSHRSNTNVSKLKAEKKEYQVNRGKQVKLSVTVTKQNKKKALLDGGHSAQLRYWSTNKKVASVNARGYIKGKGKGMCYVYAVAQNGVAVKVKVKVK